MKKNVILTAISFLTMLAPLPGMGGAEYIDAGAAGRDIWVYRGCYASFQAGRADIMTSDPEELRGAFIKGTGSLQNAKPIDAEHPLSGRVDACDIFVLDDSELFFDDTELPVGGIYGFCGLGISGGVRACAVSAVDGLFVTTGSSLAVAGEINIGGALECFGGDIAAGGINAGRMWLDSSEAPLSVTVTDSVFTGFYTQSGGSVRIGGGLYCQSLVEREDNGALLTVNGEHARYGAAYLRVSGDAVSFGDDGGVEIGGGSGFGGYDEVGLKTFEIRRSDKKGARGGAYDASPPASAVTVIVGGALRSPGGVMFFDGSHVSVSGGYAERE